MMQTMIRKIMVRTTTTIEHNYSFYCTSKKTTQKPQPNLAKHWTANRKSWSLSTGLGRLEKHVGVAIAVEVCGCLASHFDIVTTLQVDLCGVKGWSQD